MLDFYDPASVTAANGVYVQRHQVEALLVLALLTQDSLMCTGGRCQQDGCRDSEE